MFSLEEVSAIFLDFRNITTLLRNFSYFCGLFGTVIHS
jgi:hypothetical protein